MVVTEGMWESLHTWKDKQVNLWKFPVEWDSKRKKLIYHTFYKRLYVWTAVLCSIAVNLLISFVLFIFQIFGYIKLSFIPAMLLIIIKFWFVFTFLAELVLLTIGRDPVAAYNELIRLHEKLNSGTEQQNMDIIYLKFGSSVQG